MMTLTPLRAGLAAALFLLVMLFAAALAPLGAAPLVAPKPLDPQAELCARPIAQAERTHRIPGQLLAAVAVAESGRWVGGDRAVFAWPWTVTSGAKTWYFPARAEALAHVRSLQERGVRNIDVGCMQVNLMYHGKAFASLDEAFDPERNVAYAAKFLSRLFADKRSWTLAVGHYHSATPALQVRYRNKVMKLWNAERQRAAEAHRHQVMVRFEEQRRERERRAEEIRRKVEENRRKAEAQRRLVAERIEARRAAELARQAALRAEAATRTAALGPSVTATR